MTVSRVLITGANGQVGWELQRTAPQGVEVVAVDRVRLDITNAEQVEQLVALIQPDIIINAAAYTAVDKAESEKELAFAINRDGAANLARAAVNQHSRLIHISTDFVFDGKKSSPYLPQDVPNPINTYGSSKLAGELAVRDITAGRALILRTAWVYSAHGHNFVKTMLRLMQERDEIRVVCDQVGTPTWARGLAETIWKIVEKPGLTGTYHWTDAGVASWYDFAVAIKEEALDKRMITNDINIVPINSLSYPTVAIRPPFSVLDKLTTWERVKASDPWRCALRKMFNSFDLSQ
ncbi:MAG: dTDP-4-dehydrorhamnose reductase [Gammaproteobacteria bacterium]|nr:dTDP-4-dehydrorhamnose reductase [Gammaproteobacteria bacterium]